MDELRLSDGEFQRFRSMISQVAGINLSPAKKQLVRGRLSKRIKQQGLNSFSDYFRMVTQDETERQMAVDLLTTNETYFFREPKHMDFLREQVLPKRSKNQPFRIWSAACSSGEEVYTLAMLLEDCLGGEAWEIIGSDISSRVLETARKGLYSLNRTSGIPREYLSRYCLKGIGEHEGRFMVGRKLRERVRFMQVNLNAELPRLGLFDVIFLRNVMIYFDPGTKQQVIKRLVPYLKPGGYCIVSHSESLNGLSNALKMVRPSIYVK